MDYGFSKNEERFVYLLIFQKYEAMKAIYDSGRVKGIKSELNAYLSAMEKMETATPELKGFRKVQDYLKKHGRRD